MAIITIKLKYRKARIFYSYFVEVGRTVGLSWKNRDLSTKKSWNPEGSERKFIWYLYSNTDNSIVYCNFNNSFILLKYP